MKLRASDFSIIPEVQAGNLYCTNLMKKITGLFLSQETQTTNVISEVNVTDAMFIKAALSGDDEAYTELVKRHKRKVFSIASRFLYDDYELDDVCQETFIKAYQNLAKYRADAPFEHWLSKITVRCCYDALRKRRKRGDEISIEDAQLLVKTRDCERTYVIKEAYRQLYRALEELSPKDKMIIILLELEEKSVQEVASLTGWSTTNVKVRAFRARLRLKRYLEGNYEKTKK
ncbi:MAG: RNA polymerase sigma factor [Candidatus Magnetoovum sp. WYHC-5]|nr:RNA polymerase sigma factor [Candidatus Magnetoovum sp. WYHC-5]